MEDQASSRATPATPKDKGSQDLASSIKDLSLTGAKKKQSNSTKPGSKSTGYRTPGECPIDAYRGYSRVFYSTSSRIPRPLSSSDPSGSSWALRGPPPCQIHYASLSPSQSSFSHRSASGYPLPPGKKPHRGRRSSDSADPFYANMQVNLLDQPAFHRRSWQGSEGSSLHSPHGNRGAGGRQSHEVASTSAHSNNSNRTGHSFKKHSIKEDKPYETYMSLGEVQQRLKKGEVVEGILRINPRNYEDAYITAPDKQMDIYIEGLHDRNRALNGDRVAVMLKPPSQWKILKNQLTSYKEEVLSTESSCLSTSQNALPPVLEESTATQTQGEEKKNDNSKGQKRKRKKKKKPCSTDDPGDTQVNAQKPEFLTFSLENDQGVDTANDPFSAQEMFDQNWLANSNAGESFTSNWDGLCTGTRASDSLEILGIDIFQQQVLNLNKNGLNRDKAKFNTGCTNISEASSSHSAQTHNTSSSCTDNENGDPWIEGMNDKPNNLIISPFDLLDLTNTPSELLPVVKEEESKGIGGFHEASSGDEGAGYAVPPDDLSENDFFSDASVDSTASYQADAYVEGRILLTLHQDATNNNIGPPLFANGWLEDPSSNYASLSDAEAAEQTENALPHIVNAPASEGSFGDHIFEKVGAIPNDDGVICHSPSVINEPLQNSSSDSSFLNLDNNAVSQNSENIVDDQEVNHISLKSADIYNEANNVNNNIDDQSHFSKEILLDVEIVENLGPSLSNEAQKGLNPLPPLIEEDKYCNLKSSNDHKEMLLAKSLKNMEAFLGSTSCGTCSSPLDLVEESKPFSSGNISDDKAMLETFKFPSSSLHDDAEKINASTKKINHSSRNLIDDSNTCSHHLVAKGSDEVDIESTLHIPYYHGDNHPTCPIRHQGQIKPQGANLPELCHEARVLASLKLSDSANNTEEKKNNVTEQNNSSLHPGKENAASLYDMAGESKGHSSALMKKQEKDSEKLPRNDATVTLAKNLEEQVNSSVSISDMAVIAEQSIVNSEFEDQSATPSHPKPIDPQEVQKLPSTSELKGEINSFDSQRSCDLTTHKESEDQTLMNVDTIDRIKTSMFPFISSQDFKLKTFPKEGNIKLFQSAKFQNTSIPEKLDFNSEELGPTVELKKNYDFKSLKDTSLVHDSSSLEPKSENIISENIEEKVEESPKSEIEEIKKDNFNKLLVAQAASEKRLHNLTDNIHDCTLEQRAENSSPDSKKFKKFKKKRFQNSSSSEEQKNAYEKKKAKEHHSETTERKTTQKKQKVDPSHQKSLNLDSQNETEQDSLSTLEKNKKKLTSHKKDKQQKEHSSLTAPGGKEKKPVASFIATTANQKLAQSENASCSSSNISPSKTKSSGLGLSSSVSTDEISVKANKKKSKKKKKKKQIENVDSTEASITTLQASEKDPRPSVKIRFFPLNEKSTIEEIMKHPNWEKFIQKTGQVVYILEKKSSPFTTGHIKLQKDKNKKWALFVPNDHRFPRMFISMDQCPKDFYDRPGDYAHTLFLASLSEWQENDKFAKGNLIRSLGQEGDVDVETEAILLENGVDSSEFPDAALEGLPLEEDWNIPQDEYEKRRDFRDTCVFTIDPATARDLDDALSCVPLENGNFEVGVHIADVSYFVKENTKLDEIAHSRATSVYLVQKVVPMLPRILCERLCSLTPGEDKLTFSVVWEMTPEGRHIGEPWFGRSVIVSCAQFSYDHIHEILQKTDDDELIPSAFPKLYGKFTLQDVAESVRNLNQMAINMRGRRFEGGALRLDQIKLQFALNEDDGLPFGFSQYEQKDSHRLVEEYMLYANMAVAHRIYDHFPEQALLRRHPPPQTKMLADIVETCAFMGIEIESSSAGSLQKSISGYMSNDVDDLASLLQVSALTMLCAKTMMTALYFCSSTSDNPEYFHHYALNVPLYTHFTSPIRRYPDIIVHRLLAASLGLQNAPLLKGKKLERCADHCNHKKYNARRVHELSCELFLTLFIQKLGKLTAKAMVISVLDHSLDLLVDKLGIVKRVYCNKLEYKFLQQNGVSKIEITWKKPRGEGSESSREEPIIQTLQMFSIVDVLITPQKGEPLKLNATLLPPS